MTEFELHQLALVSRYEFDIATVVYMAWTVVFLFLCRDRTERWSRGLGLSVAALYVIGCALIAVRCIAAMNRYGKELALLAKHPSIAIIMNPGLQTSTLVFRVGFFVIASMVALHFIRLKATIERAN
ncbi:MAG TPA: hypothetical protein VJM34_18930 [Novosphingobium sp.]|nr:hypothetical protein [Novosphingobium sp.]